MRDMLCRGWVDHSLVLHLPALQAIDLDAARPSSAHDTHEFQTLLAADPKVFRPIDPPARQLDGRQCALGFLSDCIPGLAMDHHPRNRPPIGDAPSGRQPESSRQGRNSSSPATISSIPTVQRLQTPKDAFFSLRPSSQWAMPPSSQSSPTHRRSVHGRRPPPPHWRSPVPADTPKMATAPNTPWPNRLAAGTPSVIAVSAISAGMRICTTEI